MSDVSLNNIIIAIVVLTDEKNKVGGGGAPIFYAANKSEQEKISMLLARITLAMVHDLENGVKLIVKH